MTTKLVNVRLPEKLYRESKMVMEEDGYKNVQELMTVTLRERVQEQRRERALELLSKLHGSIKRPLRRLTKKQKEEIAKWHTPEKAQALMKKYGFVW